MEDERETCREELEAYAEGRVKWSNRARIPWYVLPAALLFVVLLIISIYLTLIIFLMNLNGNPATAILYGILDSFLIVSMIVIYPTATSSRSYIERDKGLGFHGLSRNTIAMMLSTLDQVCNGLPTLANWRTSDITIVGLRNPLAINRTIRNLADLMPAEFQQWYSITEEPLRERNDSPMGSFVDKTLMVISVFGLSAWLGLPAYVALFGVPPLNLLWFLIAVFAAFFGVCIVIMIYLGLDHAKTRGRLRTLLNTPEIQEATRRLIEQFVNELQSGLICPVRVFLIGQYRGARRTGHSIVSSTGVELFETFVLPHWIDPPRDWVGDE